MASAEEEGALGFRPTSPLMRFRIFRLLELYCIVISTETRSTLHVKEAKTSKTDESDQ